MTALALSTAALLHGAPPAKRPQDELNQALHLIQSGKRRAALAVLQRAVAQPDHAEEARFLLGATHFELRDYSAALQSLAGMETSLHAERVLYMQEESSRLTGQAEQARRAFHELNTRFPNGPWIHMLMAAAYETQAQPEKAIAEYQEALSADATQPNVRFALGYLYWRANDTEQARSWLTRELTVTPCHSLANYYLGETARADRDLSGAEAYYRKAIACDSQYGEAHLRLGTLLANSNKVPEALRELRTASVLMPDASAPHYQLGSLYRRLGQPAKAEAEYATVRAMKAKSNEGDEKLLAR
jgi:tetratricopeptide (TPR) repeat protein